MTAPAVPPRWLLWLSFLGTPALWFIHFQLVYAFNEATCALAGHWSVAGLSASSVLFIATLLFAGTSLGLTTLSWQMRRTVERTPENYDDFLPTVGLITGSLVTFVFLVELLPILILPGCR
jgi:hypothetical protein